MYMFSGLLVFCVLHGFTYASQAQDIPLFDLEKYTWNNRLLVVFAEKETSPAYTALAKEINERRVEFDDRDLVLISLFEKGKSYVGKSQIPPKSVGNLRDQFDINQDTYRVYLIGKDGGIKREGGREMRLQDLFALIDTMPMRRSEMRKKKARDRRQRLNPAPQDRFHCPRNIAL